MDLTQSPDLWQSDTAVHGENTLFKEMVLGQLDIHMNFEPYLTLYTKSTSEGLQI